MSAHTPGPWGFPCRQCNGELAKATAAHPWTREEMAHSHAHATPSWWEIFVPSTLQTTNDATIAALEELAKVDLTKVRRS